LLGAFVLAHWRVFQNPTQAKEFLEPMRYHLRDAGLGSISEIFNGNAPMQPQGCVAQAWSVAEVLRAWLVVSS
jgi:glycogen debranching enzyme